MTVRIAEVRRKLTKLKLDNPGMILPIPLCGKGVTAKKLQEVYNEYSKRQNSGETGQFKR